MNIVSVHAIVDSDVLRVVLADGRELFVPQDSGNGDYFEVQSWISGGGSITPAPTKPLTQMKAEQTVKINQEAQRRAEVLINGYPEFERLTWETQKVEALAYQADNQATVPYLTQMATVRGIAVSLLVNKVLENVTAFSTASATLAGQRQALIDQLDALTEGATEGDVTAVWWGE